MSVSRSELRRWRLNRGLSIRHAAREMGVDPDALARAERGEGVPHPRNAKKIADFYGHQVTDLWPIGESEGAAA